MIKRVLSPMLFLGLLITLASPADAQVVTCAISSTGASIGAVPALPGVTANASDIGLTEAGASGPNGIADVPGGGRVRISCTNANPTGGPSVAVNTGVVALTVTFGAPITNNQTHPTAAAGIRLINSTGDFAAPGAIGPTGPNPGNIGIAAINNAAGQIVIGLGTPGSTVGSGGTAAVVPSAGITFSPASTSTFELAGWLLSTNGKTGPINATLTSSGVIGIVSGSPVCAPTAGPCTQVISGIKPSLQDPTVPTGTLPALVTSLPNLGTTPIAGGPAVVNSNGVALKSNFTIRVRENYADLFKSAAQFNTGAVFPPSSASSVQVGVVFNNIPPGLEISGCAAVLTDLSGSAPALPGGATVTTTSISSSASTLTVLFTSPVDQSDVDVLWITCTKVGLGTASLPLPSTPVTAQVFLGPTGAALSQMGGVLTGLTNGQVPRYSLPASSTFGLISFGSNLTTAPSTPPATVTAMSGTPQTIEVGDDFNMLRVAVRDRFDNPVSGATVTFASEPGSSAGATFPKGASVITDQSGQASIEVRANFNAGAYLVSASTGAATPALFSLKNTQRLTVSIPALVSGGANQLGVAWTNTSGKTIVLTATARGYDGQLIGGAGVQNPATVSVPAGGQLARLATEIFGAGVAGRSGWIEVTASDPGANGFFQLFDNALSTSDGAAFPTAPSGRLVFPRVDSDTILHIVNTGDRSIPAAAVLAYNNSGTLVGTGTLSIGGKAGWSGRVNDLISSIGAIDGYVVVDTQGGLFTGGPNTLVGMQTYQSGDSSIVIGQPEFEFVQSGYAVHTAIGGGYTSRLILVNPVGVQQQLQITLNGATVQRSIAPYGRLDESLSGMFNLSGAILTTGALRVQASRAEGVSGYVEIAASGGLVRTTTPIANDPQTGLTFSHVAQGGGYFTGLAILNTQTDAATVTIEVHSESGALVASKVVSLQGGERLVGLISELFPNVQNQMGGFVRVVSTRPVLGLQIFGSLNSSGGFLTNVPPGTF